MLTIYKDRQYPDKPSVTARAGMMRNRMLVKTPVMPISFVAVCLMAGCGEKAQDTIEADALSTETVTSAEVVQSSAPEQTDSVTTYKVAMPGASVIPYPMYPNATKYRIGGENGLKIVLFETEDTFEIVDEYFQHSPAKALARLEGMDQYVRYASEDADNDPWGTHRPGIVIHQFASVDEAVQYGASPESRTNIIMSYR